MACGEMQASEIRHKDSLLACHDGSVTEDNAVPTSPSLATDASLTIFESGRNSSPINGMTCCRAQTDAELSGIAFPSLSGVLGTPTVLTTGVDTGSRADAVSYQPPISQLTASIYLSCSCLLI
jgi:hypothetical protein